MEIIQKIEEIFQKLYKSISGSVETKTISEKQKISKKKEKQIILDSPFPS